MADRYAVATGNWNTTATWSDSSGGAPGFSFPVAGDNVFLDAASGAITVTVNVTSACANFNCTGFTGTFAGSSGLSVSGNFTWGAGMNRTHTGTVTLTATATGRTITSNGISFGGSITINGVGGEWTTTDALVYANNSIGVNLINGSFILGADIQGGGVSITGTAVRALNLGSYTWTLFTTRVWDATTTTNLTFTCGTSTISLDNADFVGGGLTYATVTQYMSSAGLLLDGANTFTNLTLGSFSGALLGSINLTANQVVTGTLTFAGNNGANRAFIRSNTRGTARTITAANTAGNNFDLQDITAAGAATWDYSGAAGAGNCGGNTGITFTPAANMFWFGTGNNFSTTARWFLASGGTGGAGRSPLPQDTAKFDGSSGLSSGTVTQDQIRIPNVDWTGATGTPTWAVSSTASIFGSITLISGMNITGTTSWTWEGRGAMTFTSAGKTHDRSVTSNTFAGSLTMGDAWAQASGRSFTHTSGGLSMGNFTFSSGIFSSTNTNTRTLTPGSGVWSLSSNAGTVLNLGTVTGLTLVSPSTWVVNLTYSGSTGTRNINCNTTIGAINVTAGTDTVAIATNPFVGTSFNFTGFSGTYSGSQAMTLSGSLTLSTGMTRTYTGAITLNGTTGTQIITSNGKTFASNFTLDGVGGTFQFIDTFVSTGTCTLTNGAVHATSPSITFASLSSSNANTRTIAGAWILTGTGTVWDCATSTSLTVNSSTSVKITNSSATARTFAGGGKTYGNFWNAPGAGTATLTFTGSNTFADFKDDGSGLHTILFTAATTTTVSSVTGFLGNLVTINSVTAAAHDLVKTGSGLVKARLASVTNSHASPASTWYAGVLATDGGGNTGWIFLNAPGGAGRRSMMGVGK